MRLCLIVNIEELRKLYENICYAFQKKRQINTEKWIYINCKISC
jgi:hypothetical protein